MSQGFIFKTKSCHQSVELLIFFFCCYYFIHLFKMHQRKIMSILFLIKKLCVKEENPEISRWTLNFQQAQNTFSLLSFSIFNVHIEVHTPGAINILLSYTLWHFECIKDVQFSFLNLRDCIEWMLLMFYWLYITFCEWFIPKKDKE